jgi:hypothetical protein
MPKHIVAGTKQETPQAVSVEIKDEENDTVGYLEITATPRGVAVQGWHGDDSEADGQLILLKEGHA